MRRKCFVALMLMLGGCGSVDPLPEEVFLRLRLPTSEISTEPVPWTDGELRVAAVKANGLYRERAVVYSIDEGTSLKLHRYLFWLDAPAALVQQTLVEFLERRGVATHVVNNASMATTLEVAASLNQYDQLISDRETSMQIKIDFQIRTKSGQSLLTKSYSARESTRDASPSAVAEAMGRAITKVYTEFADEATSALYRRSVNE